MAVTMARSAAVPAPSIPALPRRSRPIAARVVTNVPRPVIAAACCLRGPKPNRCSLLPDASATLMQNRVDNRCRNVQVLASATPAVQATSARPPATSGWKGANLKGAAISIGVGLAIRYLIPVPAGLTPQAWSLMSIFVATIVGLVVEPLPTGAWAMLGATTAVLTKTLTFSQTFGAFCNDVIWLIVASFFFAKGLEKTGLGNRVAQYFVKVLGKSTMGLSYGLTLAETAISPAMPSTSARAGGIFMPIIKSLAEAAGSLPGKSANRMGSYLIACQMQASSASSTLFLTAAAQNLLCLKLAAEVGAVVSNPWITWFKAAIVPAGAALLLTPWLVFKLAPPELQDTPEAPAKAEDAIKKMGPMSNDEKIMAATMLGAVILWVTGEAIGVTPVTAALLGLGSLLLFGVLEWKDCLTNTSAWDTLTWFAVLVGMSGQLNAMGVIKVFSDVAGSFLQSMSLSWGAVFAVLHVLYFALHYGFASQTAHVGALYSAFIAMMLASGCPPTLAALSLAFNTNLFGAISHYSSGQAAVFCGAGYLEIKDVFRIGAIFGVVNMIIFAVLGMPWWKLLGLW